MKSETSPPCEQSAYSAAQVLLATLGNMLAAIVVAGILAGHLGLPITGTLLIVAACCGALLSSALLVRYGVKKHWLELLAVLVAMSALGAIGLALAWPTMLPLGLSVDATHHFQLIEWIATHQALPPINDDTRGLLGEMNAYPPGFALVVLAATKISAQPLLESMYPTAALLGALVGGLVVQLAAMAGRPARREHEWRYSLALLLAPLLLIAHRTFFMEAYIDQSYYTMLLGVALTLLVILHILRIPGWLAAGQAGLALAALLATYPLWAPLPAALAVFAGVQWQRAGKPRIRAQLAHAGLMFGPALAMALFDVLPRLRTGQAVLAHEGLVTLPSAARLIPIFLALPGAACLLLMRRGYGLLLAAGLGLAAVVALALLTRTGLVAGYHAYKLLFLLTPLAAAIVAGASAQLLAEHQHRRVAAGAILALATLTLSYQLIPARPIQLLSPDIVAAARWLRTSQPEAASRAPVVGTPLGPLAYWVQIGLLGQRRSTAAIAQRDLTLPLPPAESWLIDPEQASVALAVPLDATLPSTHTLAQFGTAGVIARTKPLDIDALNPLAIRYRCFWEDGRLKTAIELRHPLAGPLPSIEVTLFTADTPINTFVLTPDPQRTRTQFLGVDLLPITLGGEGYVNTSSYPVFAPPATPPGGPMTLRLRLMFGAYSVDERTLASFTRSSDGQITQGAVDSGELVYVRHLSDDVPPGATPLSLGDGLQLTGKTLPAQAQPGSTITLGLVWRTLQPIERALFPEIQLLDSSSRVVASEVAAPQQGFYPTWRWRVGEPVAERRTLMIPSTLQPGTYQLVLRIHDFGEQRVRANVNLDALTIQ